MAGKQRRYRMLPQCTLGLPIVFSIKGIFIFYAVFPDACLWLGIETIGIDTTRWMKKRRRRRLIITGTTRKHGNTDRPERVSLSVLHCATQARAPAHIYFVSDWAIGLVTWLQGRWDEDLEPPSLIWLSQVGNISSIVLGICRRFAELNL